jgi:threonine/homoserine/homoserine lactone efflux protein
MSSGITLGNKKTIPTILGGAIAALVLMSISAIGLGAILVASETLFFIIKLIGAAYLIYLGYSAWKEGSINTNNKNLSHHTPSEHPPSSLKKALWSALATQKTYCFLLPYFLTLSMQAPHRLNISSRVEISYSNSLIAFSEFE